MVSTACALSVSTVEAVQRRTVRTLVGSQMLGGLGVASGIAVSSLLAEQILGSPDLAGLANTAQVLGAALLSIPAARLMAARGRRAGLVAAYLTGILGAVLAIAAAFSSSFPLLLVATSLFGASTTANNQARYAATDLAAPDHRGRALSVVVWATTLGAVVGPNLVAPAGRISDAMGLPALSGAFLFSAVGFLLAAVLLFVRMRPDPLVMARQVAVDAGETEQTHGSVRRGLRVIRAHPMAMLGLVAIALGHTVMVSVMVMTPLHMDHGGAELRLIGLVLSVHVFGMFAFAPVMGWLVDRVGGRLVVVGGAATLLIASLISSRAPEGWSDGLVLGLFLLGVGWSATLVAGSTLLTEAVPQHERPGAQGASDLVMGLCAGLGGGLSGVVVGGWGYPTLCLIAAALSVALGLRALAFRPVRLG
ncbi:MAG: MFS transporter [Actinomycetota bacterium]